MRVTDNCSRIGTMNILRELLFEIYEKLQLRKWQGVGHARNFSYPKRNDIFYLKLKEKVTPILLQHEFKEVRKRRFIRRNYNQIDYYEFGLTKRLNGLKISYGSIILKNDEDEKKLTAFHSLETYGQFCKDWNYLKPKFWNYSYEYPIKKNDKLDAKMILDIETLLIDSLHVAKENYSELTG